MNNLKLPWLAASSSLFLAMAIVAYHSHQPKFIPDLQQYSTTGELAGEWQDWAGLGKVASLILGAGAIATLRNSFNNSDSSPSQSSVPVQPPVAQPIVQSPIQYSSPAVVPSWDDDVEIEIQSDEPEFNLLEAIADSYIQGKGQHIIIPSRTGAGKTTFEQSSILTVYDRTQGAADFRVIGDIEQCPWLGLEDEGKVAYLDENNPESILKMVNALQEVKALKIARTEQRNQKGDRYNPKPFIAIFPEWNEMLKLAKDFDPKVASQIIRAVESIINRGRKDGIFAWLDGQSHLCKNLELDTTCRGNMTLVGLAASGDTQVLDAMIEDRYVIPSARDRERVFNEMDQLKRTHPYVCFTNFQGCKVMSTPTVKGANFAKLFGKSKSKSNVIEFTKPTSTNDIPDYWAN